MTKVKEIEIINHGKEHSQYFQGCGTTFTEFEVCFTGIGENAKEAYEDAVEQACQYGYGPKGFPKRPTGICKTDKLKKEEKENLEFWWHVSIRVR